MTRRGKGTRRRGCLEEQQAPPRRTRSQNHYKTHRWIQAKAGRELHRLAPPCRRRVARQPAPRWSLTPLHNLPEGTPACAATKSPRTPGAIPGRDPPIEGRPDSFTEEGRDRLRSVTLVPTSEPRFYYQEECSGGPVPLRPPLTSKSTMDAPPAVSDHAKSHSRIMNWSIRGSARISWSMDEN